MSVLHSLDSKILWKTNRRKNILLNPLTGNGTGLTIPSVINDFAQSYGMYAEEKIEKLPVPQFVRD